MNRIQPESGPVKTRHEDYGYEMQNKTESRRTVSVNKRERVKKHDHISSFDKTPPLSTRIRNRHASPSKHSTQTERGKKPSRCKMACKNFASMIELWGGSLRSIEGHQGTGVVSYFVLLRWLFLLNVAMFVICFIFLNLPVIFFTQDPLTDILTTNCSARYDVPISGDASELILDFFLGSGWMEKSVLFYGFYTGSTLHVGENRDFYYNFPVAYILIIVTCLLFSLFFMARHSAKAFQKGLVSGVSNTAPYSSLILCGWDYSVKDVRMTEIKLRKFKYMLHSEIQDQKFLKLRDKRMSRCPGKCAVYSVRILINLLVIVCLAGSGAAIYYASIFSAKWTAENTVPETNSFLVLLVELMPSLVITILNAVVPLLFEVIVLAEHYTQQFIIKITLIRTVFLKLSSLVILVISIYNGVISCESKNECGINTKESSCPEIICWETYVGQELYKLVIINSIVTVAKVFLYEFPRRLLANRSSLKIVKWLGPPEFNVPVNVLSLVYGQSICWLGVFFAPLFPAMYVIQLFITFYVLMLSALYACEPPNRPYRAARTNIFFMVVLLIAFFMCSFPVIYAMSNINPSKGCGPFRSYDFPYTSITSAIRTLPNEASITWNVITSPAVTASFIVILLVLLYFCSGIRLAHKNRNRFLTTKFQKECEEKQLLLKDYKAVTGYN